MLKNPSLIFNEVDERGLLHKVDGEEVTPYILRPLIKQYIISIILENSFRKLKLQVISWHENTPKISI